MSQKLRQVFHQIAGEVLHTERLTVRRWNMADAGSLARFLNRDNFAYWQEIGDPVEPGSQDFTATEVRNNLMLWWEDSRPWELGIFDRSRAMVGTLQFYIDERQRPRLTYFILPSERGKGYGFEAYMAALKNFGARNVCSEIFAETKPGNRASQNFLRKAGFAYAGKITGTEGGGRGRTFFSFRRDMKDLTP